MVNKIDKIYARDMACGGLYALFFAHLFKIFCLSHVPPLVYLFVCLMAETPASLLLKKQLRGKIPALITEISEKRRACLFSI
jgi:hypothetical protein